MQCLRERAGAIQNGEVRYLLEAQLLKQLEQKLTSSSEVVEKISKSMSKGGTTNDTSRLRLVGNKENQRADEIIE